LISYAQHSEDLKLVELLGGAAVLDKPGFYVDIGAWHPTNDSVTKLFYDRGWRGINVEPQFGPFTELCIERPRDTNLPFGVSNENAGGQRHPFTSIGGGGLSTFHPRWAAQWSENMPSEIISVPVFTLKEICDRYVPATPGSGVFDLGDDITAEELGRFRDTWSREIGEERHFTFIANAPLAQFWSELERMPIDFMKIDVEGWEHAVISGGDWEVYRPKVLCIEATEPGTEIPAWADWEPMLLDAGYEFVEMAAVNRYYVDAR
jgi:hypothetical protein